MSCQLKPLNKQSHSYCYPGWVILLSGLRNNSRYNVTALPKKQKKELRPSLNLCVSEINLTEVQHFVHWTSAAIYNLHPLFSSDPLREDMSSRWTERQAGNWTAGYHSHTGRTFANRSRESGKSEKKKKKPAHQAGQRWSPPSVCSSPGVTG